ncbi:hypothetical protein [Halorubrum sp. GN11GM_10-3_MGM]|uniref:hypothetical protein n=1 Tax=Halorubrum sp. GN11GM_10-3_MGM TaxID=2518111 RepID=UPI0010F90C8E|nr:hypothetical protein [Halorubrum sp. GN11GM_10-3_MGM]TKX72456.1 hypothetical protein EXE40_04215 [Halorubrum sp. GN11GM_10-3_MGM]
MVPALGRIVTFGFCILLLGSLFVLAGTGYPAPPRPTPDLANPDVIPEEFAGEHVETGGKVIATDPAVIEIDDDTGQQLPIENAPDVKLGHDVIVDGTLTTDGTLIVNPGRAVTREPWETTYMYAISALATILIAARGIDGWQFDRVTYTIRPRATPLHERYVGDHTASSEQQQDNA